MWKCPKCGANVADCADTCIVCGYQERYTGRMTSTNQEVSIWKRVIQKLKR